MQVRDGHVGCIQAVVHRIAADRRFRNDRKHGVAADLSIVQPVTVTVWGVSALSILNVSVSGDTTPSAGSELRNVMVTGAVGIVFNITVKRAFPPRFWWWPVLPSAKR